MATGTSTQPAGRTARNQRVGLRATALASVLLLLILAGCSEENSAAEATATTASSTTTVASTTTADGPHPGQETYESACAVCHDGGAAGAPKFGDPDEGWATRIAQGIDVLYDHAVNGFEGADGMMPAKGGRRFLDDESVKAAVDYMVENSQ
ncbi:MAG: c-type cytochrome [Acidimicrobiia bacterium]|nr:c-type cytochrome [Acidimicrobiia bacterium]MBT8193163.1 c-type cytochrome [Acidimicrobiia bacterium]MBT8246480.1 c-type cytochrome [Acidimicrobiia bacterium]NNF88281.1 cytochrome c5 family protein [Acidimicrobiia bacterium]NNJ48060.1 cytochrome c5 family protein [Acidimicrobiia bacterium]